MLPPLLPKSCHTINRHSNYRKYNMGSVHKMHNIQYNLICLPGLEDVFFSPQDLTVREGEAVFFQCVSGESSPLASITWLKDGKLVTRGNQFQVKTATKTALDLF